MLVQAVSVQLSKDDNNLKQCPKCGQILKVDMWKKYRLRHGSYMCPKCESKHHWKELNKIKTSS